MLYTMQGVYAKYFQVRPADPNGPYCGSSFQAQAWVVAALSSHCVAGRGATFVRSVVR